MKHKVRGESILLRVEVKTHSPGGMLLPEKQQRINFDIPLEVVAIGTGTTVKVGDKVLLETKPIVDQMQSLEDVLFKIPGDNEKYVLVPEYYVGMIYVE